MTSLRAGINIVAADLAAKADYSTMRPKPLMAALKELRDLREQVARREPRPDSEELQKAVAGRNYGALPLAMLLFAGAKDDAHAVRAFLRVSELDVPPTVEEVIRIVKEALAATEE